MFEKFKSWILSSFLVASMALSAPPLYSESRAQPSNPKNLVELVRGKEPKTLSEIVEYLENIKFIDDLDIYNREYIQSPRITLEKKTGDCDCIAVLSAYFLEKQGMPPLMLLLFGDNAPGGHMVGLAKKDKGKEIEYGLLEKSTLIEGCKSIDEAIGCLNMRPRYNPKTKARIVFNVYLEINLNDSNLPFDWRTTPENIYPYLVPAMIDGSRWKRVDSNDCNIDCNIEQLYLRIKNSERLYPKMEKEEPSYSETKNDRESHMNWQTLLVAPPLAASFLMWYKLKKKRTRYSHYSHIKSWH